MDRRVVTFLVFIFLVMATVPLVLTLLRGEREAVRGAPVQSFEFDGDRRLEITGGIIYPMMRPRAGLYYSTHPPLEATRNGEDDPEAFFASLPPDGPPPQFMAHMSEDGELVGIAAESDPRAVLILHDFATGESWPHRELIETADDLAARAAVLVERLNAERDENDQLRAVRAEEFRALEDLIELPAR